MGQLACYCSRVVAHGKVLLARGLGIVHYCWSEGCTLQLVVQHCTLATLANSATFI